MSSVDTPTVGRRYRLDKELGRGGMGIVYRAYDRLTGESVALKTVTTLAPLMIDNSTEGTDLRLRLAHEFKIAASLCHPYIIRVLDYGFGEDKHPYFTMQLLQNAEPLLKPGTQATFENTLELIIQTLQALTYLHRNQILHLDLKPENVLVIQRHVRVVDFGIATVRGTVSQDENLSGTLAYIAPELLMGAIPTPASDLYAVGIMLYELLTGVHPFDTTTASALVRDTLYTAPNLLHPAIPEYLIPVLEKLLHKESEQRYQDAAQVLEDLRDCVDFDFPAESKLIRESFLQSASFIGREQILQDLFAAYQATADNQGSLWFIGGENGVGKSRLLSELHTQLLVRGALLLRGEAVREGGNGYQLWEEVIRRLVVMADISEQEASILKPLVPDIDTLLEKSIPPAPPLEGSAAQDRLADTLENILSRQHTPVIILLEDLHWADPASLALLKHLYQHIAGKSWMIVATYRDDESPKLPEQFPDSKVVALSRFSNDEISNLCEAILGKDGQRDDLLRLLRRETDGNVLFIVEILRILADEAGQLDRIRHMQLPERIISGGIESVVQHRLQRVPEYALFPLQLAAVIGRELNLDLIKTALPDLNIDNWLLDCNYASVLEVEGDEWRFSHNRMRDSLVADLPADVVKDLHRRAADAILALYGSDYPQPGAMALHLDVAGDLLNAAWWYARAGKKAEEAYAPEEAIANYRQALKYLPETDAYHAQRLAIYAGLGKMLRWQAAFDDADTIYEQMRVLAENLQDKVYQARAWIGLSDVQMSQGKRDEAYASAEKARDIAESAGAAAHVELSESLGNIAWGLYRKGEFAAAATVAQRGLLLSQALQLAEQTARNLNTLSIVNFMQGSADVAQEYMQQALAIARERGDRRDIGIKLNNLGEFKRLMGEHAAAIPFYTQALDIFQSIGYRDAELATLTNLGSVNVALREYARAEEWLEKVIALTARAGWWGLPDAYLSLAEAQLAQGKTLDATGAGQMALQEGQKSGTPAFIARAWRTLGRIAAATEEDVVINNDRYSAVRCYQESLMISEEQGDEKEQLITLRLWADWEYEYGDEEIGANLTARAGTLETKINSKKL